MGPSWGLQEDEEKNVDGTGAIVDPSLEDGVVAIVDGKPVDENVFKDWLAKEKGRYYLNEYLDRLLVVRAAEAEGIIVSADALEEAFQKEWQRNVTYRFRGNEAAYLEELERTGRPFEVFRDQRMEQLQVEILTQELVRSRRDPNDEELQKLFKDEYGAEGIRRHIRVAFFDKFGPPPAPGEPRPSREDYVRIQTEARSRADSFVQSLKNGIAFGEAVQEMSDDLRIPSSDDPLLNYKDLGGEMPNLRGQSLGREIEEALSGMGAGDLSPIIDSRRGFYVVQVVDKTPVKFEEVQDDLLVSFLRKSPHAGEIFKLKEKLRREAKIVKKY